MTKYIYTITILISLLLTSSCAVNKISTSDKLNSFFKKKEVTIVVTDSGLGGLSVAAELENRIKKSGVFKKVNIVFFNALAAKNKGYNRLKTTEEKVAVFDSALKSIDKKLKPDLLLIACNTLSVLYDLTKFSKKAKFPVVGIVGTGVDLIYSKLKKSKSAQVIIFATKTTVNQESHKKMLIQKGIDNNQVIMQACPRLAGRIERNPKSKKTKRLVKKYIEQAINKLAENTDSLYVSYNCTHYPYVDGLFRKEFKKHRVNVVDFLNPNPLMINFIFNKKYLNRYQKTKTHVRVISQVSLSDKKIRAISGLLNKISKKTALALKNYDLYPDFFKLNDRDTLIQIY